VAAEVLDRVRQREPAFLEHLVLSVLTAMGYGGAAGSAEHLGKAGDEGLDGVIRQDPLGLDRIYVQAKRYGADRSVGRPEIQEFVGALHGAQADRGIFITTSRFTAEAVTYADRVAARVVLIDGQARRESSSRTLGRPTLEQGLVTNPVEPLADRPFPCLSPDADSRLPLLNQRSVRHEQALVIRRRWRLAAGQEAAHKVGCLVSSVLLDLHLARGSARAAVVVGHGQRDRPGYPAALVGVRRGTGRGDGAGPVTPVPCVADDAAAREGISSWTWPLAEGWLPGGGHSCLRFNG
jgi:hypothetical protein